MIYSKFVQNTPVAVSVELFTSREISEENVNVP